MDDLYYKLLDSKAAPRIYRTGDCFEPGRVREAVGATNEAAINAWK